MVINRFLVIGLDPKKSDFAACSFPNQADAGTAVVKYKKLGVTPVMIDLARISPFCMMATSRPGVSLVTATPNKDNPTEYRLPRWLVVAQDNAGVDTFDVAPDIDGAIAKAMAMSREGSSAFIVAVNSALLTHAILPGASSVPPRVDLDVSAPTILSLQLPRQFVVAVYDPVGTYEPRANDGIIGLNCRRWKKVVGEYDSPLEAYAAAKKDGSDGLMIYDRDNDHGWQGPWDDPQTAKAFSSLDEYLKFERFMIEVDVMATVNHTVKTPAEMIELLRTTGVPMRRSGQTGWDRAKDWERV